jgi:cytochrome c553
VQSIIKTAKHPLKIMAAHRFVAVAVLLIIFNTSSVLGQDSRGASPRLGDLMNEAMQVHHTKLGLAGHADNWALANYELKKIEETVVEVKEVIVGIQTTSARWKRIPVGEMLTGVDSSLHMLEKAITAKNKAEFDSAYSELTAACNACHVRAGQSQIKIVPPQAEGGSPFPDQDFAGSH